MSPAASNREWRTGAPIARAIVEIAIVAIGGALLACAVIARQPWLDRHVLPSFYVMRAWYVRAELAVRLAIAVIGVVLVIVVRPRAGRWAAAHPGSIVPVVIAAALGLWAGDLVLRWTHPSTEWLVAQGEPLRQPDPWLGWRYVPARVGHKTVAGRDVEFAIDASGYRVRRLDEPVDFDRPTVVFTGESVMAGEGLLWDETVPVEVGAALGYQTANLAVHGYATDQAYLRLRDELPRFRRPVAIVTLFMTALFGRDLDDDRPHLGPDLVWKPAVPHGRLKSLAKLIVPYRSGETFERGIVTTREVLRATVALAEARGATPLILVPQFNREDALERNLRRGILDDAGLPYVFVEFDSDWRLSGDLHPNARTAHVLAEAVVAKLKKVGER
jgi:hypothetical protein